MSNTTADTTADTTANATAYAALAGFYDRLTGDIPYPLLADFYENCLITAPICGTTPAADMTDGQAAVRVPGSQANTTATPVTVPADGQAAVPPANWSDGSADSRKPGQAESSAAIPAEGLTAASTVNPAAKPDTVNNRFSDVTLLDLCCGAGTMTELLASRGYDMIGVDASPEMLAEAANKTKNRSFAHEPLFLCQRAEELDLYGTVSGAFCCLDSLNYLPPELLPEVFRRLRLFIEPGGRFAFDIRTPQLLRDMDGQAFVDEDDTFLCLWRGEFDPEENALHYGIDLFLAEENSDGFLWRREQEEHVEYAHSPETLVQLLLNVGFEHPQIVRADKRISEGRLFFLAVNPSR